MIRTLVFALMLLGAAVAAAPTAMAAPALPADWADIVDGALGDVTDEDLDVGEEMC